MGLLLAGWALTLWVAPWSDETVNDLFVYRTVAEPLLSGALPYRDFAFEYPPLAAPAIGLPGVIGTGEDTFRWAYAVWTLLGAAAVVVLCGALARATGGDERRAMMAAALMPLLCGALLRTHFDLFPVALLLAALLLLCHDRPRSGLAVIGIGAMTKAFPLVAAPIALTWLAARRASSLPREARHPSPHIRAVPRPAPAARVALEAAIACAAVIGLVAGTAVAVSPDGALDAVRYHLDRPVQIESTPALVLLALDGAGLGDATSISSHRSDGLLHPGSDAVTWLFAAAFVALVALLCVRLAAGTREGGEDGAAGLPGPADAARRMVLASLAAVAAFAVLGKVLSPQFVIWVLPLGALAFAWRLHALAGAVALAAVLTQIEFPAHYFDVVDREPWAVGIVAARNLVLLGVVVLAVRALSGAAAPATALRASAAAPPPSPAHPRQLRSAPRSATGPRRPSRSARS